MKRLDYNEPEEFFDDDDFNVRHKRVHRDHKAKNFSSYLILGAFLMFFGILSVTNRLGVVPPFFFHYIFNWKVIMILFGFLIYTRNKNSTGGIIMIVVGGIFFIKQFLPFNLSGFIFPIILISLGAYFILKHRDSKKDIDKILEGAEDFDDSTINETYIFGGSNLNITSENFKGGSITAIFGGGKLDLREAQLNPSGRAVLNIDAIFGGMEIIVPPDWKVIFKTTNIFGGFQVKKNGISHAQVNPQKQLIIVGNAVFGGGDVKRKN